MALRDSRASIRTQNLCLSGAEIGYQWQRRLAGRSPDAYPRQAFYVGQAHSLGSTCGEFGYDSGRDNDLLGQSREYVEQIELV
jgi:hypothetical protein